MLRFGGVYAILALAALLTISLTLSSVPAAGKRRFNIKLWKTFTDCFNCLPIAAIIDEKIFTMHGGLSPDLQSMEQIRRVMRPTDVPDTGECRSRRVCNISHQVQRSRR